MIFYTEHLLTYFQLFGKDENKEKEAVNGPFKKTKVTITDGGRR